MEERNKKKVFISYRFSGENMEVLEVVMGNITRIIETKGYNTFCSLYKEEYFKKNKLTKAQRYDYYKQNVKDSDIVLFFIKSDDKSGGMEFELNQAVKYGKKIILAINEKLDFSYFRDNAHDVIEYSELEQFYETLGKYTF